LPRRIVRCEEWGEDRNQGEDDDHEPTKESERVAGQPPPGITPEAPILLSQRIGSFAAG
jgi:hypothetical protein